MARGSPQGRGAKQCPVFASWPIPLRVLRPRFLEMHRLRSRDDEEWQSAELRAGGMILNVQPSHTGRTETMPNLLTYGIYLDAREGVSVENIAEMYGLSLEYVEERLVAARLCFDKQVHHIEFTQNC